MRRKNITTLGVVALSALLAGGAQAQTLTALTSFGNNGYLAPVAGTLDTGNLTRGMAWVAGDAFSGSASNGKGNLVVVNREGGINIKVIDGLSGAIQSGELNDTGVAGGSIAAINMIGSSADGKIYAANWVSNTKTTNFKIYEWDSLTSGNAPALVFDSALDPGASITTPRLGDTLDVRGSGASTQLLFGMSGGTGYYHFTRSSSSGPFTASYNAAAGSASGAYRLGITFAQGNTVLGAQGGTGTNNSSISTIGGAHTGTLKLADGGAPSTGVGNERLLDHVEIQGVNYLATVQTDGTPGRNTVRVYNINDPLTPVLISSLNLIGDGTANGNGVGQIRWGAVNGSVATLYAMNTNNGIQAMQFDAVPEPATMTLLALGALAARRRRKNSK